MKILVFLSGSFHSFIFLCVLKVRNLPTLARRQGTVGLEKIKHGSFSLFQIDRCKTIHCQVLDPLMSQESFLWSGKVLVCMLLFFMETRYAW